jgi:hypothetical protein
MRQSSLSVNPVATDRIGTGKRHREVSRSTFIRTGDAQARKLSDCPKAQYGDLNIAEVIDLQTFIFL